MRSLYVCYTTAFKQSIMLHECLKIYILHVHTDFDNRCNFVHVTVHGKNEAKVNFIYY